MTIRTFDIREDGEEVQRYEYRGLTPEGGSRVPVSGDYCRAEDALEIETKLEQMTTCCEEEKAIVNRIWEMFGNPEYEFLDGRSIYDLIQDGLDAISLLSHYREGHRQPSGQECYVNIEQGDYRCADCREADRITGMERQLRRMADERLARLRENLAKPNNGL